MNEWHEQQEEYREVNQSRMRGVMMRALLSRLKQAEKIIMNLTELLSELTQNAATLQQNVTALQAQHTSDQAELAAALANAITPDHAATLTEANAQIVAANQALEALIAPVA